jgi:hypothetical protein
MSLTNNLAPVAPSFGSEEDTRIFLDKLKRTGPRPSTYYKPPPSSVLAPSFSAEDMKEGHLPAADECS